MKKSKILITIFIILAACCVSFADDWCWNVLSGSQWNIEDSGCVVVFEESLVGPSPAGKVEVLDDNAAIWTGFYRCANGVVEIYDVGGKEVCICAGDELGILRCFDKEVAVLKMSY